MFLWALYALWAGYSPLHPGTKHSEPHFGLLLFAFMAILFFSGDRRELKLLLTNSFVGSTVVLSLLLLNVYRLVEGRFPESWLKANPLVSVYVFLLLQVMFLGVAIWHTKYTIAFWRTHPPSWSKGEQRGCIALLLLIMCLTLLAVFFLRAGRR